MSTNVHKSTLLKSGSSSTVYDIDDDISDSSSERDYGNETFEEDTHEDELYEEDTLSSLERLKDLHRTKTYPNKTFTSSQIRDIERHNAILMNKILSYGKKSNKPKMTLPNKFHMSSAAINRKKNQKKIDWENQILLRKIQSVKPSIKY